MTSYTLKYNGYELINSKNVSTRHSDLPEIPDDATEFYCDNGFLTILPELPDELNVLSCEHNSLESLPELPDELSKLHCGHNRLTLLPNLPNTMMAKSYLRCEHNMLKELPELPNNLAELNCEHNHLKQLPELPEHLTYLNCGYNKLKDFPDLPENLTYIRMEGNPFNKKAIMKYAVFIKHNEGINHDLTKFVTPDYGASKIAFGKDGKNGLPIELHNKISKLFINKAGHKKSVKKRGKSRNTRRK